MTEAARLLLDAKFLSSVTKLFRNFVVFGLRENQVSFDDLEVSDDGSSASAVRCEVSVVGDYVFRNYCEISLFVACESQRFHFLIAVINEF